MKKLSNITEPTHINGIRKATATYDDGKTEEIFMTQYDYRKHLQMEKILNIVGEKMFKEIKPVIEELGELEYNEGLEDGESVGIYC